jgi:hypothetical protein
MMRARMSLRFVSLFLLTAACEAQRETGRRAEPVFRSIHVQSGRVTLGQVLPRGVTAAPLTDTAIAVPPDTLALAERLTVHRTPAGIVTAVTFEFGNDADFEKMIGGYTATLGAPERSRSNGQSQAGIEVALWRDARTEFRLMHDAGKLAAPVRAELRDRALTRVAP